MCARPRSEAFSPVLDRCLPLRGRSGGSGEGARWRDAAHLVSIRWEVFLAAGPEARGFAFRSYIAALDAEEAEEAEAAALASPCRGPG